MRLVSLLAVLLAAPLAAQGDPLRVPHTRFVLPNGLNVILHEDHATPMVSGFVVGAALPEGAG